MRSMVDYEGYDKIKNKCKHKNTDSNVKKNAKMWELLYGNKSIGKCQFKYIYIEIKY